MCQFERQKKSSSVCTSEQKISKSRNVFHVIIISTGLHGNTVSFQHFQIEVWVDGGFHPILRPPPLFCICYKLQQVTSDVKNCIHSSRSRGVTFFIFPLSRAFCKVSFAKYLIVLFILFRRISSRFEFSFSRSCSLFFYFVVLFCMFFPFWKAEEEFYCLNFPTWKETWWCGMH